jgi:murein DD-endopeptidase MepM/ murein hydrolase activator NlpD
MRPGREQGAVREEAAPASDPERRLELQIHPGDVRRRVRYLRLSRLQLACGGVLAMLYLVALALAVAVAPGVINGLFDAQEYRTLVAERSRQGSRVRELAGRLDRLAGSGEQLRLELAKIGLAYGLPAVRPGAGAEVASASEKSIYAAAIARGSRLETRVGGQLAAVDALLGQARAFEAQHADEVRGTPALCPLRGSRFVRVSGFGPRRNPFSGELEAHFGVDLAAPPGTPIAAPADGVVLFAGTCPLDRSAHWWRLGNLVVVRHGWRFVTLFGHCREIKVRAGQAVRQGEELATVGNTGWSVSPHLHYEVRRSERAGEPPRPVEPLIYILDHRWQGEEHLLALGTAPAAGGFEPLPPGLPQRQWPGRRRGRS